MSRLTALTLIVGLGFSLFLSPVVAQTEGEPDLISPFSRVSDENYDPDLEYASRGQTLEGQDRDSLDRHLGAIHEELTSLYGAFGYTLPDEVKAALEASEERSGQDDNQERDNTIGAPATQRPEDQNPSFQAGALKAIKLKPSDKKRLIKIANGSLTERQRKRIVYDQRILDLLIKLTSPKALGGGGLNHLRVDDLLRFRHDPRSRETEAADNISAHQFGKAADITEINTTYCVLKSSGSLGLGGSEEKLPPFPVKVIWQGGAPYNPTASQLGTFDAVARANAFRDILGALPADGYNGAIQGLTDLLQQLQRRVISDALGLDRASLDYLIGGDVLETLGRAAVNRELGFAPGALTGDSKEESLRSIARSAIEQSLLLPPGSLAGDDWNKALETLGRYKVALDNNLEPADLLGRGLREAPYYRFYQESEAAFRLPAGTLEGTRANKAEAFRQIGAQLVSDRLHLSPKESDDLLSSALQGQVSQLNLGRYGDLLRVPSDKILPVLAPSRESSKKAGELFLAKALIEVRGEASVNTLREALYDQLTRRFPSLKGAASRADITQALVGAGNVREMYRGIGASLMEELFDLPEGPLIKLLTRQDDPSLAAYEVVIGPAVLEDELATTLTDDEVKDFPSAERERLKAQPLSYHFDRRRFPEIIDRRLNLEPGTTAARYAGRLRASEYSRMVGSAYMAHTFRDNFADLYHTSSVGLGKLTLEEMFSLALGRVGDPATRAGASWVEEDLGLAPDSFAVLFAPASPQERLVNAGVNVLGGNLFEAFDIEATNIQSLETLKQRLGQSRIETLLGLVPGSFQGSLETIKATNPRLEMVFASPEMVDGVIGQPVGTAKQFLSGSLAASALTRKVGENLLLGIDVVDLHLKLGWDERFRLVKPESDSNGKPIKQPLTSFDGRRLRDLLAKIGGYNLDFSFGYDPKTFDRWVQETSPISQNEILLTEGGKLYAERLGFEPERRTDLFESYHRSDRAARERALAKLKELTEIPHPGDLAGFVTGDMSRANYSRVASLQAKANKVTLPVDPYELFHTMVLGWSNRADVEDQLSQEGRERYRRVLEDYAISKANNLLDHTLGRITKGVLDRSGSFNPAASPYPETNLDLVELAYFSGREARSDYLFGLVDGAIRRRDSTLPQDFSQTLMEGANIDRSRMVYTFLGTKIGEGILNTLPADLQPVVAAWLTNLDPARGQELAANGQFTDWASDVFSQYTDNVLPPGTMALAVDYLSGNFNSQSLSENPDLIVDFNNLGPDSMTGLVNKELGLEAGTFGSFYNQYKEVQGLIQEYKAGNLDISQAAFAIDSILFGGQIAQLTYAIDDFLGLPPGSTQLLIQYALTQNPIYLVQFAFNFFGLGGGTTVDCPDLQLEAQKNVKKLLRATLEIGQDSARLIPSQIITFHQDYLVALEEKIRQNYFVCSDTPGSRCGLFARPEYAKQVHIGF